MTFSEWKSTIIRNERPTGFIIFLVAISLCGVRCQFPLVYGHHLGCFRFTKTPSGYEYKEVDRHKIVEDCTKRCNSLYYSFALLLEGRSCYCDNSYTGEKSGNCSKTCDSGEGVSKKLLCGGGNEAVAVYDVNLKVPGPPVKLALDDRTETSLSISWSRTSNSSRSLIEGLRVRTSVSNFSSVLVKDITLSGTSNGTTVIGLNPGTLYNVSVSAFSSDGEGPSTSSQYWTEVGVPRAPPPPRLVVTAAGVVDADGRIRVKFAPKNENGLVVVTAYRIVVIDETDGPVAFRPEDLHDWPTADRLGLRFYVAAQVPADYFDDGEEFVVGDLRYHGGYFNYGPLSSDRDYHVTVGAVSSLNNVTKVAYADVGHDQHSGLVIFRFPDDDGDSSSIVGVVALSVAVAVVSALSVFALLYFVRLRRGVERGRRRRGRNGQELTACHLGDSRTSIVGREEGGGWDNDDGGGDTTAALEELKGQLWTIPKNFFSLTNDVKGRGKFGSVVGATVNRGGTVSPANAHVVAVNVLSADELSSFVKDLQVSIRCGGSHSNLIRLVGMCEDKDTAFIAFDSTDESLKRVLLDARALDHSPVYSEKNKRFSTVDEDSVVGHMLDVARGMDHLAGLGVVHKQLCARNVFVSATNGVAKVGGFGIVDFREPGSRELDVTRWTAHECLRSGQPSSTKSDVWSFGVFMWEAVALGATPYHDVKPRDVANRVLQGVRLLQLDYVSDELYQLMRRCWQLVLDERPSFSQLEDALTSMQPPVSHASFALQSSPTKRFKYEKYSADLEFH